MKDEIYGNSRIFFYFPTKVNSVVNIWQPNCYVFD